MATKPDKIDFEEAKFSLKLLKVLRNNLYNSNSVYAMIAEFVSLNPLGMVKLAYECWRRKMSLRKMILAPKSYFDESCGFLTE